MTLAERLSLRTRVALFFALIGAAVLVFVLGAAIWLSSRLDQTAFSATVSALTIGGFALLGLIAWVALKFDENLAKPLVAIAADFKTIAHTDGKPVKLGSEGQYLGLIAPAAKEVADALEEARNRTEARIAEATDSAARQQQQLEALLRDLHHGIIICSMTGRVSLYNQHAVDILHVDEFKAGDPGSADTVVGTLGLGRDLFNIVDRKPFKAAAESLQQSDAPNDTIAIVFSTCDGSVTMRGHVSLRVDKANDKPVGMTIVFEDVTDELAAGLERDRVLRDACEELAKGLDSKSQDTLLSHVETAQTMLEQTSNNILAAAWPTSDIRAGRLFKGAVPVLANHDLAVECEGEDILINGDSATLISLLRKLLSELVANTELQSTRLEARGEGFRRQISIAAHCAKPPSTDWIAASLEDNADDQTAFLSGNAILERHRAKIDSSANGNALTITLDFASNTASRGTPKAAIGLTPDQARPEFYDFEIFSTRRTTDIADVPLSQLYCVVFDCEMTGLDPRAGDEIVSIAGVRVVNGRVLTGEKFNQLINPGRPIPPASTAIHHISDDMVVDAPEVGPAVKAFHNFAHDQVLIAHNAAFDMAFLAKSQKRAGVNFGNTVLDTVLLAAHLQGTSDSLTLDALAERYKVVIPEADRHTALGDALATAQVFCQMVKQLEQSGVVTLGDALAVSEAQTTIRRRQQAYT